MPFGKEGALGHYPRPPEEQPPADAAPIEPVQTSGEEEGNVSQFPELEGMFDKAFGELNETVKELFRAAAAAAKPEPESELEVESEISPMPKMDLTPAEFEKLKADRNSKQVEVSDEEAARILVARGPKKASLEDLDPENWSKLSEAQRAEVRRQVHEAVARAQRGE
jgi:hypothetical protein